MLNHPIGGEAEGNDAIRTQRIGIIKIPRTRENMCFFSCLALTQGEVTTPNRTTKAARSMFREWWVSVHACHEEDNFRGVTLEDLPRLEQHFNVRGFVYTQHPYKSKNVASLIRKSAAPQEWDKLNLELTEDGRHFDWTHNMTHYADAYSCKECGQLLSTAFNYARHKSMCKRSSAYKYIGGPYYVKLNTFDSLQEGKC